MKKKLIIFLTAVSLTTLSVPALADNTSSINNTSTTAMSVQRIYGLDRYQTAIAIADQLAKQFNIDYSKGQKFQAVILASGNNWPDAISGTALAKVNKAPILLLDTETKAQGSQETFNYIRNHVSTNGKVFILGGKGVMPEKFTQYLVDMGFPLSNIQQIGGIDRVETSFLIAKTIGSHELKVVSDENFYDALSANPLWTSRDGTQSSVLLMPKNGAVSNEEKQYIKSLSKGSLFAIGDICSTADLESLYYPQIGSYVNGGSEYATNSKVIGQASSTVYIATGEDYPDALTGSVLANCTDDNNQAAPIILVKHNSIAPEALSNLESVIPTSEGGRIKNIVVLGGDGAVSENAINQFANLVNTPSIDKILSFKFINNPNIHFDFMPQVNTLDTSVPFDTDVTALIPEIIVSDGATIYPESGIAQDFTMPVTYTVTARDGRKNTYTVRLTKPFPYPPDGILNFGFPSLQAMGTFLDPTTITVYVPHGTDVSKLAPTITLAPGETVSPGSGEAQDFSSGLAIRYVVTKPNGSKLYYRAIVVQR